MGTCEANGMRGNLGLFLAAALAASCGGAASPTLANPFDGGTDASLGEAGRLDGGSIDAGPLDGDSLDAGSDSPVDAPTDVVGEAAPVDAGPVVSGAVTITPATTVATVPAGMAGLSYEKSHLIGGYFSGDNAPLVALFQLLGPSILRVGGNSVDETSWYSAAPADAGASTIITQADVDALAAFAKNAGWRVLYGVNMKTSDPATAAEESAYAATALGKSLYGFEIGNEVDRYKSTALSSTWSYSTFTTQWEAFDSAILTASPKVPLTGPASATHYDTWTVPFASDEGARIILLTQHYYRGNGQSANSTLAELLQPDPALVTELQGLSSAVTSAASHGKVGQYRMSECNSFYNGGAPNISDAYGTALWAIDYLFTNAQYGSSGANFHGGGNGPGYTPIADANDAVVGARPEFYGLLFFAKVGAGTLVSTTATLATSLNFTAYAVQSSDKSSMNIALVNKDATSTLHLAVDAGEAIASADVTRLQGPSLDSTTGVTLGGASIDATGAWAPAAPTPLSVTAQTITVDVPPASAALVHAVAQ